MINNINSYSNYNYYTNTLNSNKKNSKTNDSVDNNNNKEINNNTNLNNNINSNNNISNNTSLKQTNSNLVSDKSKAVNKILGYGVDEDGFFTSDFNEAAGIPKDYKINAKLIANLNKTLTTTELIYKPLYNYIDWAKELGNFYNEKLQSLDRFGENFNKEKIESEFHISLKNDFEKSDVLLGVFISNDWTKMKESQSTLFGKTYGFDESISKKDMTEFYTFMQKYQLKDPNKIEKSSFKDIIPDTWMGIDKEREKLRGFTSYAVQFHLDYSLIKKSKDFEDEFDKLMSEDLSLEEFKTKYMDFKKRHDEFVKEFETAMGDNLMVKPFKPIQAESKNKETYKDEIKNSFWEQFLKVQKENGVDILELMEKLNEKGIDKRV
ncbi:hypothetical protein [Campylobacter estrildidarum]|uniref:Uncharacterized protein n=1 Tax=Campylobacter estrildidarum TaxID=2510189 RepID=A0A4U7BQI1_9BACT|nr:hypothetical protein [Campylobacter estrildidarum]TKX30924.1 hypothetical protein CQA69_04270 [Campylobacter estrildidarum]